MRYLLICALLLSSCAGSRSIDTDKDKSVLTPADLNSSISIYDDKLVIVKGFLVLTPEAQQLWQSKKIYRGEANKHRSNTEDQFCLTLTNTDLLEPHLKEISFKEVTLSGTFKSDMLAGRVIHLGACYGDSGFEVADLLPNP